MNLKNSFDRLFFKNDHAVEETTEKTPDGWDDLTSLNQETTPGATFDDLATVPFAGASVTEDSVTPEHVLPSETQSETKDASEQAEAVISPELQAFKNFFKTDHRIKRKIMDVKPSPADDYDEASCMRYVDKAYRTFQDFRSDFAQIEHDFGFGPNISQQTDDFFQRGAERFARSNYDVGTPMQISQQEFSGMRRDFIEKVKKECVGYSLFSGNFGSLIASAQSVNELLHAYHSYIMSNEAILQEVPLIAAKENADSEQIALRGDASPLAQQIFDAIPDDLKIGVTDIIAADENIMMMVRDRGHALTISAEPDGVQTDKMWVEYNVPKLCNIEMIKALPGLDRYSDNGARGRFFAPRDELGAKIVEFIEKVPTDKDALRPGGMAYRDVDS